MSVQDEYAVLIEKVASLEGVNLACAKKALTELLDERYGGAPNALRYRAFTDLNVEQVERAKKYLRVYLQSNRFKQEFPETAWLIFGK
ncbi:MAG: hypothetical protein QXR53_02255 [Candidatus Norongarragalinales archaeon]